MAAPSLVEFGLVWFSLVLFCLVWGFVFCGVSVANVLLMCGWEVSSWSSCEFVGVPYFDIAQGTVLNVLTF